MWLLKLTLSRVRIRCVTSYCLLALVTGSILVLSTSSSSFLPASLTASAVFASPARLQLALESGLWFCDSLRGVNYRLSRSAGQFADIVTLELAKQHGLVLSHGFEKGVALSGCSSKMMWLHMEAYELHSWAIIDYAVLSGSIDLLKLLQRNQGVAFTERTMGTAAECGHTHVCDYLLDQQCPYDEAACQLAASNGHTSTLHWLREHAFPWDWDSLSRQAARSGSMDTLQYLIEQGAHWDAAMLTIMLSAAASEGKLEAAEWLRQQGAEWAAILHYDSPLARHYVHRALWHADAVAYAREQGCTSPESHY
jgi:hypothetical protein